MATPGRFLDRPYDAAMITAGNSSQERQEPALLPGDEQAGRFAYVAAGLGGANLVTLGLMYAIEVPRNGPYRFGAINDFGSGLYFLSSIPVLWQIHRRLDDGPLSRTALWTVVGSSVAAAGSSFLLAFHVIPFAPSTAVTVGAIVVQSIWATVVNAKLLRRGGWPNRLARLGRGAGIAMLAGMPILSLGFLAPSGSALRYALFALGGTLSGAAWIGWPVWYLMIGRSLSRTGEQSAPRSLRVA
jgi:hypothetical protein